VTRKDALLYARTRQHAATVERAQRIVTEALAVAPSWYVAFSGGKDSTCVLHLVREQAPDTAAQFSARQWDLPETLDTLAGTPNLRRTAHHDMDGSDWLPSWDSPELARQNGAVWLERDEYKLTRGAHEDGVFLGLRSAENEYRRRHLLRFGPLFRCASGMWHANPIAAWSVLDVWAYILSRDVPYNRAYDVMERLGVSLGMQRIGPFSRALNAGSLAILKRGWPEVFNRLSAAHPEARAYA
jgi:phosphoadenosine phosphosulfate reductase